MSILAPSTPGRADRPAQRRGGEADRAFGDQRRPVAPVERVPLHVDEDVEVAAGGVAHACLALAGDADAGAFVDPGGDLRPKAAPLERPALAVAGGARIGDRLPASSARRAAALDDEEALLGADLAGAVAGRRRSARGSDRCAPRPSHASHLASASIVIVWFRCRRTLPPASVRDRSAGRRRGRRSAAARAGP